MFPPRVKTVYLSEAAGGDRVVIDNRTEAGSNEYSMQQSSAKLLHNIRGIIFDFDGTLFDNALLPFYLISAYPLDLRRIWRERLVRKYFAGRDYNTPEHYYRAFFAAMGKACLRRPEQMRHWYFDRYMPRMIKALQKHYKPRPGVNELFQCFDDAAGNRAGVSPSPDIPACNLRVAVYSDYPFLRERMEALGVCPGEGILLYGPESFGAQKPAVRPFRQIAGDLGVAPEEVLVIGDRKETDGLGAFNAGMRFFCLETGHKKRYFRLDPYRRPPEDKPHGPSLVMYAGIWEEIVKVLLKN